MFASRFARKFVVGCVSVPVAAAGALFTDHELLRRRGNYDDLTPAVANPKGHSCLVIGGGVVGVASAYLLQRAGFQVTLLESHHIAGYGTSNVNAGTMRRSRYSYLVTPSAMVRAFKQFVWPGELGSVFQFEFSQIIFDPYFWRWGFRVFMNSFNAYLQNDCISRFHRTHTHGLISSVLSVAQFAGIRSSDFSHAAGSLNIQVDDAFSQQAKARISQLTNFGISAVQLSKEEALDCEPTLKPAAARIISGTYCRNDVVSDCGTFTRRLAAACSSIGVKVEYETTAVSIEHDESGTMPSVTAVVAQDGRRYEGFDQYVICAGCGSAGLLRQLGIYIPLLCVKGYALTLADPGVVLKNPSLYVEPLDMFISQYRGVDGPGTRLRFTTIAEFAGWDEKRVTPACVEVLKRRARAFYPEIREEVFEQGHIYVGGRPWTSDDLPVVGGTRFKNVWINTGHGHFGWRYSCGTAELLVASMLGKPTAPCGIQCGSLTLSRYKTLWPSVVEPVLLV
eukprot:TRINITY_DN55912_c0_g1_i1.p1 TRINITY_DN55912_c0_g1~~TRINITY_DN55912_c0_g1_i1.p1  ORF type:complete len:508 (+),score=26.81 TRINITY_DN55912_c0_g1_i1:51-1574(+)